MRNGIARTMKGVLRRFQCDVRTRREPGNFHVSVHHPKISAPPKAPPELPRLFQNPVDALFHLYGGKPASFVCAIDRCVAINGLNFRDDGWHPYTATLLEYARGETSGYQGSSLQHYYERWQPKNIREAFLELPRDRELENAPSHLVNLYPWSAKSVAEADETMKAACYRDHVEHGRPDITVAEHGYNGHGPVSEDVMRLEFDRLVRVYESLAAHGYRREYGDIRVLAVRRGDEYRFILSGGGHHRTAAMKALGYRTVSVTFNNLPTIFDAADIPRWAQVIDGIWSERMARAYVDHMFDFDAYAWAEKLGLVPADRRKPSPRRQPATAVARAQTGPLNRAS